MWSHPARSDHVRLRGSVLAGLAALTSACNAVLGVEDVALDCHVNPDFPLISSSTVPTSLRHSTDGNVTGPELHLQLETAVDVEMVVSLYHNAPGTYQLVMDDGNSGTCDICVAIYSDFPTATGTDSWTYQAFGQGTMTLTAADSTGLSGSLHDLKFRHVLASDTTDDVDLDDGCAISVEEVEFNATYSFPTTAAR